MELTSMDLPVGLEQQGGHQAIYIENASDNTAGHGKEQMTDALAVYDLFIRLDKRFQTDDFQMVFDELTPIFYATGKGDDELETYEKSVNVLGELFVDNFQSISSAQWAIRDKLYKAIGQIGKNITAKQGTMKIETLGTTDANGDFTPRSPNEIANKARDNIAYRYALVNLNPFAVLGADYSRFNQNGELDLYNPITGEGQLSGMYLADRAEMLHNLIHANIHDTTVTFTDAQYIDLPKNVFLNIGEDEVCKTFAFGGDNGEELKGINLPLGFDEFGDRLYGMGGNDILRGYGGEDYLEGGRGYDELYGGDDNDTFAVIGEDSAYDLFNGGEGEDKIIGGAGDDTIRMHDFSGDNTVEEIDGREGLNIVAGTALDDKLDFSGTVLESIDHIDGGGGHDDIIGSPGNDHLKGGAGYDSLKGGGGGRHPRRW
jgi:Ca2+-binding RTX toxin-like protein